MNGRLLACCLAAGLAACQRVGGPHVNLQRMNVQPRYEPYGSSAFFADSKAMQLPPPGTVAREDQVGVMAPPPLDSTLLALGHDRYHVACAPCHGEGGFGGGMVARNLPGVPGLALQGPATHALSPGQLFARIRVPGDVRHARAAELSAREQWAVAVYLHALLTGPRSAAARQDSAAAALVVRTRQETAATLEHLNGVVP